MHDFGIDTGFGVKRLIGVFSEVGVGASAPVGANHQTIINLIVSSINRRGGLQHSDWLRWTVYCNYIQI